jgi:putative nucleotidyltransferase with HDIG domain
MADDLVHDRDAAWALLTEWTQSEALRRHALVVEAATRAYAREFGEDEAAWGNVALLHDFDYERHPTLDEHPQDGAPVLRERGYPDWFVRAILSHAHHTDVPRESRLERTLFACDEMAGFVHACGLVRPDGLATLEPKSVKKKLKQPSFARGVSRDDVVHGAEELGVPLDEHIAFVTRVLRPIARDLGLPG